MYHIIKKPHHISIGEKRSGNRHIKDAFVRNNIFGMNDCQCVLKQYKYNGKYIMSTCNVNAFEFIYKVL